MCIMICIICIINTIGMIIGITIRIICIIGIIIRTMIGIIIGNISKIISIICIIISIIGIIICIVIYMIICIIIVIIICVIICPAWGGGPLGRCPWPSWPGSLWGWVGRVGWGPGVPFFLRGRKSPLGVGCPRVAVVGRRRRLSSSSVPRQPFAKG